MPPDPQESLAVARWVDSQCDRYEKALHEGRAPRIEDCLTELPPPLRQALLQELLGLEIDDRVARLESPTAQEYASRFPELSEQQLARILEESRSRGDPLIGRSVHVYQCVSLIGSGAMGRVYLAMHDDLQRHCALKILAPRRAIADHDFIARFHQEGRAAAALIHPNIVTLHAVGRVEETHFLEMEYVPGCSLQQLIREEGPFPIDRALRIAAMVADGLAAAHRAGIVHRDVKPDNILVTLDGVAKIGDFGLAHRVLHAAGDPFADRICGTPSYMAPELFQGAPASPSSDVYALGLCLYQMLIGSLPWQGHVFEDLVRHGRTEVVPDVRHSRPELSAELAECVALLTAAEPGKRPADAAAASLLLHAVLGLERDLETLLIEAFGNDTGVTWVRDGERYRVTRHLPHHRRQDVVVESTSDTAEDRLLLLYSICCPATPEYYEQALRQNAVIMHGSLAIWDVNGQSMFVLVNAYPRSAVSPEEIRRSVIAISTYADEVEQQLTGEDFH